MDWEVDEKMPKYDDIRTFQVWVCGQVRRVKRVGNRSNFLSPGTLQYLDCTSPFQNAICDESNIQGWRLDAGKTGDPT